MTIGILMLLAYIVGFGTAFIQQQIKNDCEEEEGDE